MTVDMIPTTVHDRFAAWVTSTGKSKSEVARLIGCDPSLVSRILARQRKAGLDLALAIEEQSAAWEHGPIRVAEWRTTSDESTSDSTDCADSQH